MIKPHLKLEQVTYGQFGSSFLNLKDRGINAQLRSAEVELYRSQIFNLFNSSSETVKGSGKATGKNDVAFISSVEKYSNMNESLKYISSTCSFK